MLLRRYAERYAAKPPFAVAIAHQAKALVRRAETASGGKPHNVATLRRVMQTRANVVRFQIREIDQNLRLGHAGREHLENVGDANTHSTNAGASPTLQRVERDSVEASDVHLGNHTLPDRVAHTNLTCHSVIQRYNKCARDQPPRAHANQQNAVRQHVRSRECNNADRESRDRYALLSEREREVLGLIVAGLTNKEIGCALTLSPRTVETHRANLFAKLEVESLAVLIRRFAGLVEAG